MLVYNMGGVNEFRGTEHTSNQIRSFPRDLLQRFISRNRFPRKFEEMDRDEEENIELSLGLSLNGHFGVDPQRDTNLIRSSSISNFLSTDKSTACSAHAPLVRTCSLPTEAEEDSLRRMMAKRKRAEKLKNVRVVREKLGLEENWEENGRGLVGINGNGEVLRTFGDDGIELKGERVSGLGGGRGLEGLQPPPHFSSQGSIGSQGSGSSGVSDFQSQPIRGTNRCTEVIIPASVQSLPEKIEQKPVTHETANDDPRKLVGATVENPSTQAAVADDKETKERVKNMMIDMPCVSTRGDGPNGKRIEGFLYRYRKGEEVRIVCVCHGSFLSPAEFVKHAGGGDVAHPHRHIVVNPSPFL